MKLKQMLWSAMTVVMVFACADISNINDIKVEGDDAEFAIPLINSTINLEDIFNQSDNETELVVHPDNSMSLFYSGDVLMQDAGEIFGDSLPGGLPIPVSSQDDTIPLPFQRLKLLRANLTGDSIYFLGSISSMEDVNLKITVPTLLKNGNPLIAERRVTADGGNPVEFVFRMTMNELVLKLYENQMIVQYEAIDDNGMNWTVDELLLLYNKMTFDYVEGFFTKNDVNIPGDAIDIDVYDQWITGDLYFDDPKVTVTVDNSFGFPVRADVKKLRFIGNAGQEVDLKSPQNDKIDFDFPRLNEIGVVKRNKVFFDVNNSNIDEIINIQPRRLEYDIDAIANPDRDSTIIGFFTDSSFIRINVMVELPVSGWANGFEAADTVDLNLGDVEGVKEAEFKLKVDNEMPVSTSLQLYFVNENGQTLDSLFAGGDYAIGAAEIDNDGFSTVPFSDVHYESMTGDRIDRLLSARRGIIRVSFLTKNAPNSLVKVRSTDDLGLKMGVKFKTED